jgi:hypothetical protein
MNAAAVGAGVEREKRLMAVGVEVEMKRGMHLRDAAAMEVAVETEGYSTVAVVVARVGDYSAVKKDFEYFQPAGLQRLLILLGDSLKQKKSRGWEKMVEEGVVFPQVEVVAEPTAVSGLPTDLLMCPVQVSE